MLLLANEVGDKGVDRLVVDAFGVADLQNVAVAHDHHGIAHGERFLLVVRYVDKCDAQALLHAFQLQLHFLAQL